MSGLVQLEQEAVLIMMMPPSDHDLPIDGKKFLTIPFNKEMVDLSLKDSAGDVGKR